MIVYRNYNLKIIRELLKEIGVYKYEQALQNMQVKQKPLSMKGWYLEAGVQKSVIVYHPRRIKVNHPRRVKVNHLRRTKVNH